MNVFRHIAIKTRLWLTLIVVVMGASMITVIALSQIKSQLMNEKEIQARKLVETAHSLLENWHQRMIKGEIDPEAAKIAAMESIKTLRYDGNNYFWINDMKPRMVMHPIKPKLDGKDLSAFKDPAGHHLFNSMVDIVRKQGEGLVPYLWPKPGNEQPVPKVSYVKGFEPWGWIIGSGIYVDDVDAVFWRNISILGSLSVVLLSILEIFLTLIIRSITKPLQATTIALRDIAAGEGDLTRRLPTDGQDEVASLAAAFNEFTGKIQRIVIEVGNATQQLAVGSDQLAEAAARNNQNIDQQESETQQVATAITEMTATVSEIARGADSAAKATRDADSEAAAGRAVVSETRIAINSLAEDVTRASNVIKNLDNNSEAIGSVLDVIRSIAEQTNLLALNAAIEVARAGEQAVVSPWLRMRCVISLHVPSRTHRRSSR